MKWFNRNQLDALVKDKWYVVVIVGGEGPAEGWTKARWDGKYWKNERGIVIHDVSHYASLEDVPKATVLTWKYYLRGKWLSRGSTGIYRIIINEDGKFRCTFPITGRERYVVASLKEAKERCQKHENQLFIDLDITSSEPSCAEYEIPASKPKPIPPASNTSL